MSCKICGEKTYMSYKVCKECFDEFIGSRSGSKFKWMTYDLPEGTRIKEEVYTRDIPHCPYCNGNVLLDRSEIKCLMCSKSLFYIFANY